MLKQPILKHYIWKQPTAGCNTDGKLVFKNALRPCACINFNLRLLAAFVQGLWTFQNWVLTMWVYAEEFIFQRFLRGKGKGNPPPYISTVNSQKRRLMHNEMYQKALSFSAVTTLVCSTDSKKNQNKQFDLSN